MRPEGSLPHLRLPAPAKLNLFLRIVGRRADGYHELQTVFQFIDLCDDIELTLRRDGVIERQSVLSDVPAAQDLCVRAARALKAATGSRYGADIRVTKRIPMGGGLGGGSSDAASVLLGLNALWSTGLTRDQLAQIGLKLGADVPVFVRGNATWAEGIGERFTLMDIEERPILLALPAVHMPTAEVFNAPELTRDCIPLTMGSFPSSRAQHFVHHLMVAGNVCEAVVRRKSADVAACLDWLGTLGVARMTGTGAACFAVTDAGVDVTRPASATWEVMHVRTCSQSPALSALT